MRAALTDGHVAYQQVEAFDLQELSGRNEPLRTKCFSSEGRCLEWRPESPCNKPLPKARLCARATVAFEILQAEIEYQDKQRTAEEIRRRQLELQRLLKAILDEVVETAAMITTPDAHDLDDLVQATADDLTFRIRQNSPNYSLQIASYCPACSEPCWTTIDDLAGLGALLLALPEAELSAHSDAPIASPARPFCTLCPTCEQIAANPFFGE